VFEDSILANRWPINRCSIIHSQHTCNISTLETYYLTSLPASYIHPSGCSVRRVYIFQPVCLSQLSGLVFLRQPTMRSNSAPQSLGVLLPLGSEAWQRRTWVGCPSCLRRDCPMSSRPTSSSPHNVSHTVLHMSENIWPVTTPSVYSSQWHKKYEEEEKAESALYNNYKTKGARVHATDWIWIWRMLWIEWTNGILRTFSTFTETIGVRARKIRSHFVKGVANNELKKHLIHVFLLLLSLTYFNQHLLYYIYYSVM